ncbi:MAG: histidinol-phosphate transaminase [Alphaproteobacteria bacterium]
MTNKLKAKSGIEKSPPYIPGAHSIDGVDKVYVLSANENPLGTSADVKTAIDNIEYNRYPDGGASALRNEIANIYNVNANNIVCGNGSDELLHLLVHSFASTGDEVLFSQYAFLVYKIATLTAGATPVVVGETDYTVDVDKLLAGITDKTKIIMLANPANPTGTMLPESEIVRLIENTPDNILIVIDCAYAEYCTDTNYGNPAKLVEKYNNVVMTRTFSKIYGLAGFRLGWCYAPDYVVDILNRIRGPFNVSSLAQIAGAKAVKDTQFVKKSVEHNSKWLNTLTDSFKQKGFVVPDSKTNFILVDFGSEEKADAVYKEFLKDGLIVRAVKAYDLPSCIRITIGNDDECKRIIDSISKMEL